MEQTFELSPYFAVRIFLFLVNQTVFQGKQVSHPCDLCGSHRTRVAKLHEEIHLKIAQQLFQETVAQGKRSTRIYYRIILSIPWDLG